MTDPWGVQNPPTTPVPPPPPGYPPADGQAYGQAYGQASGQGLQVQSGPPGTVRSTGKTILLFVVTLGIYSYVYNYQVHDEMKRHSGRGLGGGIALLLSLLAGVAMPFLTPNEVGALYTRRGDKPPVRAWTGLWVIIPAVVGYIVLIATVVAIAATNTSTTSDGSTSNDLSTGQGVGLALGLLGFGLASITGSVVWFVKTNGALNRYWQSLQR